MDSSDKNVLYYGKTEDLPVKHLLKAGDLDVIYENGSLRYISVAGQELIRNIYSAVRDRNWGTVIPKIVNEKIQKSADKFEISYNAIYKKGEIDFVAEYIIVGAANSSISFSMKGKAQTSFLKNRIGFCILHPLDGVKGKACKIIHPENKITEIYFPENISPHQPETNILSMEWENETAGCQLHFEGDVWEMEDHRNWTDSSYKTYCTPLSIPFPVKIHEGDEVVQKVLFKAEKKVTGVETAIDVFRLRAGKTTGMPEMGTSLIHKNLTDYECNVLRDLGLKFIRHDVKFSRDNWMDLLDTTIRNSKKTCLPLELVLHFTQMARVDAELFQKYIQAREINVRKVWFVSGERRLTNNILVNEVLDILRDVFPGIPIGGGTDAYFAEFNRNRFDASRLDFLTYAVCPQVHAFDNDSLAENMASQADTVESASFLYPEKEIHVSPVTLKQRFNVVATGEEPPVPDDQLPTQVDERQMSLFAAGWTLGSLASLATAGAKAVTYYETPGWRGIFQGDEENPRPSLFAGRKRDVYPICHLLKFLNNFGQKQIIACQSSHPMKFTGVIAGTGKNKVLILASHVNENLEVNVEGVKLQKMKVLSEENMAMALRKENFLEETEWKDFGRLKVFLKPYSIAFIEAE